MLPPVRNCTCVTVAPAPAVAVAESVTVAPTVTTAPLVGAVMVAVGVLALMVTLTADEVTAAPLVSVTLAVSEAAPAVVGGQLNETELDAGLFTVPTTALPERNSTLLTVAGLTAVAVAVSVVAEFVSSVAPAEGAVSETLGAVTLTLTIVEVAVVPLESVTFAVSAMMPEADGVQLTE